MILLGNRLLIEPIEQPEGAVVAPELSRKLSPFARVVQLGQSPLMPPELQVGQTIHVDTDHGHVAVIHKGRPHRIVSVLDVQLIFGIGDDLA